MFYDIKRENIINTFSRIIAKMAMNIDAFFNHLMCWLVSLGDSTQVDPKAEKAKRETAVGETRRFVIRRMLLPTASDEEIVRFLMTNVLNGTITHGILTDPEYDSIGKKWIRPVNLDTAGSIDTWCKVAKYYGAKTPETAITAFDRFKNLHPDERREIWKLL